MADKIIKSIISLIITIIIVLIITNPFKMIVLYIVIRVTLDMLEESSLKDWAFRQSFFK